MKFSFRYSRRIPKRNLLFAALVLLLLSFLSSAYFHTDPSVGSEVKRLEKYIHRQQKDFQNFLGDTVLLRKLVQQTESLDTFKKLAEKPYGIYLYAETLTGYGLIFWNNQKVMPPPEILASENGVSFLKLSNGYYVVIRKNLRFRGMSNRVQAYALIPVYYKHDPETKYLVSRFAHDNNVHKKINVSFSRTQYDVRSAEGKHLFYISRRAHVQDASSDTLTLLLRLASLILLLIYIHLFAESLVRSRGSVKGVLFMVAMLVLVRAGLFVFPQFFQVRQFPLFSPEVYGSSGINATLGDLLLNAVVFCWIVIFSWYKIGPVDRLPQFLRGRRIYIAGIFALFFLILSTFYLASTVRSLVADSTVSFMVTDFFSLSEYTVIGFVVLALLSLGYYYFSRLLFRFIFPAFENRFYLIYFFIGVIGLVYLTLRSGNSVVLFHLPVLLWLVLYTLLFSRQQFFINRFKVTLAGVLFWIFVFSASLSAIILQENQEKEKTFQKRLAEQQDRITDPSQMRTLSIALTYLDEDFFRQNFRRFQNPFVNKYLRDSIANENFFASYRKTYTTKLFVFDSLQRGLFNEENRSYAELDNIFTLRSKPTDIPYLYYHEPAMDQVTYISKRIITDSAGVLGTFFIVCTPRKYNSEAFLPELFSNVGRKDIESLPYAYAIYLNNKLSAASNKYPFKTYLSYAEVPKVEFDYRSNNGYDELWYRVNNNKVVVIAKKQDTFLESITLFSYLFCAFVFMVAVLQLFALLLRTAYGWKLMNLFSELSIRAQVHGTIIMISLLSFLIIGAATISFFIIRYNRNNIDRISRTAGVMEREIQKRLSDQTSIEDLMQPGDSTSTSNLQKLVDDVAQIHIVSVNIYDVQGNLLVTSIEEVYKKGVLSTKMHPEAFYHLDRLRQVQFVQEEEMSSLEYLSMYTAIRNKAGDVLAYLNIPYFTSQIDLNQEISNFLVTIINLNAFIFLIAGVIALFITNKITRSFSVIGDKMRDIELGKTNEEIVWTRKDEIGELVRQYNKMVHKLEESAAALAKSEREGAWREMARQVAHEIKNPLTPMKLSIQYLQKAISNGHSNVQELTTRVAGTLVEQIDHLSKIAADFSRFANIGNQNLERFDLHDVLESLVQLYQPDPKVDIRWKQVDGAVLLLADRTHINRLFTNLLTNAVEACGDQDCCRIELLEERREEGILVQVKDNGEGIPVEMQPKIFTPNFTTKTSGTGLGLAMCKGIVEQAGGRIWFQTKEGEGTAFFVLLPVAEEE